jgi:hypothetical protein
MLSREAKNANGLREDLEEEKKNTEGRETSGPCEVSVIFLIVKEFNQMRRQKAAAPVPVATKECPRCLSVIPLGATRCPHCTSELK